MQAPAAGRRSAGWLGTAQPPAVAPRRNERPSTARSATGRAQGERPPASL